MPRELDGYRDEMESIISVLGRKGFYTTAEIALLDFGEAPDAKTRAANLRAVRRRYGIQNRGLTIAALAKKRVSL